MKKIFILLLISSFSYVTTAQNLSVPQYGIKAGINYSNLNFTQYNYLFLGLVKPSAGYEEPTTTYNTGIKAGFFVDIKLTERWYISPSISYSQFGGKTEIERTWNDTYPGDTIRTFGGQVDIFKMDYITIDPNFEYRVTDRFSLVFGPSSSYLISNNHNKKVTEEGDERIADQYDGEIEEANDIDAGVNLGTSYFLTEKFDINLNLYIGLLGLENKQDGYDRALQAINLSLGYTF